MRVFRRRLLLLLTFLVLAEPCISLDLNREIQFDIPAQSMGTALVEFSRQAKIQVITSEEQLRDRRSRGASGRLTIARALGQLLDTSGLSFKSVGQSAISVGLFSANGAHERSDREKEEENLAASPPPRFTRVAMTTTASFADASATAASRSGATDNAQDSDALDEVVVTATRSEQPLDKVPVSVVAFTQATLDKLSVRSVDDIGRLVPGLDFDRNGFGLQSTIAIRGISSTVGSATTGIYIDETPIQARTLGNSSGNAYPVIFDLERVEVLRGPQGTLFGAASEGGNVRFITPEPSLTEFHGYTRSEVATTDHGDPSYEAGAAIGGPIIADTLGFRVSVYYRRDGGYIDREHYLDPSSGENNSNYLDSSAVRLAFKWVPLAGLSITPSVFYQQLYQNDTPMVWSILSNPATETYVSGAGSNSSSHDRFALPALAVKYDLDRVQLISNTSYYDRREASTYDYTLYDISYFSPGGNPNTFFSIPGYYSNSPQSNDQHNFVQEVRLQSAHPEDRLTWVAGLFYSDASQNARETVDTPFLADYIGAPVQAVFGYPLINGVVGYIDNFDNKDIETAAFGNVSFAVTDKLRIAAGARASRARFDYSENKDGPAAGGPSSTSGSEKESPVNPKYTISYQDEETLYYASAAKGYRIGGANPPIPQYAGCTSALASLGLGAAPLTYKSDSTWSYELGTKSRLDGGRADVAASVFYIDWSNIIQAIPSLADCPFSFTTNLGKAVSKGFDVQGDLKIGSALTLSGSASFTDAKYTESIRSAGATQDLVTAGHTLGGSPWNLVASAEYRVFGSIGTEEYFRIVADYRSENDAPSATNDPHYNTYDPLIPNPPATTNVDLRAGTRFADGWDVSLFAKNVLNADTRRDYSRYAVGAEVFTTSPHDHGRSASPCPDNSEES